MTEQLGIPESALRVISPDVGGGFGYKGKLYPEEGIIAWAARRLRPSGAVGRDPRRELRRRQPGARSSDPRRARARRRRPFPRAARRHRRPISAPMSRPSAPPFRARSTARLFAGGYRTPAIFVEVTGVFTNTTPTDAFRGAGRPEACYVLERLADTRGTEARHRSRGDPAAQSHPARGDAVQDADRSDLRLRRLSENLCARARARRLRRLRRSGGSRPARRGRLRGIGIACYVESSGVAPSRFAGALGARVGFYEAASIRVEPDGAVRAMLGTHNHGQGHATTFAQILASRLGVAGREASR